MSLSGEKVEAAPQTRPVWDKTVLHLIRAKMPALNREKIDSLAYHIFIYAEQNGRDFKETTEAVTDALVAFAEKNGFRIESVASVAKDLLASGLSNTKKRKLRKYKKQPV